MIHGVRIKHTREQVHVLIRKKLLADRKFKQPRYFQSHLYDVSSTASGLLHTDDFILK